MEAPAIPPPLIVLRELRVGYAVGDRRLTVLDIPAWELAPGEQAAVFGPSGCGKSTLLHLLSGILPPTSGRLRVCGSDLAALDEAARDAFRARCIGYVFQGHNLLPGFSALENVLLGGSFSGRRPRREEALKLLTEMGLRERAGHLPGELSLGEQQRVAIARALIKRPPLVLADEPTASLDPRRSEQVLRMLRSACREAGSTLLVVTHDPEVLDQFERRIAFVDLNRAWNSREYSE